MGSSSPQIILARKTGTILQDILAGIKSPIELVVICDRATAIRTILQAQPGDGILIAGKGHEDYQTRNRKNPLWWPGTSPAALMERQNWCNNSTILTSVCVSLILLIKKWTTWLSMVKQFKFFGAGLTLYEQALMWDSSQPLPVSPATLLSLVTSVIDLLVEQISATPGASSLWEIWQKFSYYKEVQSDAIYTYNLYTENPRREWSCSELRNQFQTSPRF